MASKKKKKNKNDGMVLVDPKILAAAAAEGHKAEEEYHDPKGNPLVTSKGEAELGDGLVIKYDPKHDMLDIGGRKVTKLELWQFVYSIVDANMREQIMPIRQTEVMHFTKVHTVQLKRDLKAGQFMKVRCHNSVPVTVVEGLAGLEQKKSPIILA